MTHGDGGKGDKQRPTNHSAFAHNFDRIFGRKPPVVAPTPCEVIEELETEHRLLKARTDRLQREVEELRAKGLM